MPRGEKERRCSPGSINNGAGRSRGVLGLDGRAPCAAGRLHHKSLPEEDLFEVGGIPTGGEAFVLHAELQRVVVLQEAQRGAA